CQGPGIVAERVNPTAETNYWRENYAGEPYYEAGRSYEDYRPAYKLGWSTRAVSESDFDALEPALAAQWNVRRGSSSLDWAQARPAARAAWERADSTYFASGDPDDDSVATGEVLDNEDVVEMLNALLQTARDSEFGFQACADEVGASSLQQVFHHRAEQCHQAADELVQLIRHFGGTPAEGSTVSGTMHRGWVRMKGEVGANSGLSMLEECERAEDVALARYRTALEQNLPPEVRSFVERQAQDAQHSHDQLRELRLKSRGAHE
ncbi:PA2169 family four-helix-bundle protein, partial [Variovorax paradoxus]|nr:PA2169 family four-helix-bundle protein [Variovorax paradoxus]